MALVACKECPNYVSEHAGTCPYCGIDRPGTSWEEMRLEKALEEVKQKEIGYMKTYMYFSNQNPVAKIFNWGMVDKYVDLAKDACVEKQILQDQLWQLQRNRER